MLETKQEIEDKVEELVNSFHLAYEWEIFWHHNPSNNLPYHNLYHTRCMIFNCYHGARYYNLPYSSIRSLLLAAMYHDYGHSGGKSTDSVNISQACNELYNLYLNVEHTMNPFPFYEVKGIIEVTEYPYVREPVCIEQEIIRDADLIQSLMPDGYNMVITGLKQEMEVVFGRTISHEEMIEGQIKFMKNITFFTEWAQKNYNPWIQNFIYQLQNNKIVTI